jgi:hypothetical protein
MRIKKGDIIEDIELPGCLMEADLSYRTQRVKKSY